MYVYKKNLEFFFGNNVFTFRLATILLFYSSTGRAQFYRFTYCLKLMVTHITYRCLKYYFIFVQILFHWFNVSKILFSMFLIFNLLKFDRKNHVFKDFNLKITFLEILHSSVCNIKLFVTLLLQFHVKLIIYNNISQLFTM